MTTPIERLRACLHVAPHAGAVCTVRESDLREALSLIESMRACCADRGDALTQVIHGGVVHARICAEPCGRRVE